MPNSAVMITSSEKPFEPSGIRVVTSPIALRLRKSATVSSIAPAYSPCSGVEEEVAAALDDAGVEREADAVRRLEAEPEVGGAEVAVAAGRERQLDAQPDVLDDGLQRSELALDRRAELERDRAVVRADGDRRRLDLDRPELDVRRQLELEAATAAEVDALAAREADDQRQVDLEPVGRQQRGEEAVASRRRRA